MYRSSQNQTMTKCNFEIKLQESNPNCEIVRGICEYESLLDWFLPKECIVSLE